MAEEIVEAFQWTDSAKRSFSTIVEYLGKEWTEKEVEKFIRSTAEMLTNPKTSPRNMPSVLKTKAGLAFKK